MFNNLYQVGGTSSQSRELYSKNGEEADMRICRHAYQSNVSKILIYSTDTDVYKIGLPLTCITSQMECVVQINLSHSSELRFVSINDLKTALDVMMTQIWLA